MGNTTTIHISDKDISHITFSTDSDYVNMTLISGMTCCIPSSRVSEVYVRNGVIRGLKLHNGEEFDMDRKNKPVIEQSVIERSAPPSENKKYFEYGVLGTIALTTGTILVKAILA